MKPAKPRRKSALRIATDALKKITLVKDFHTSEAREIAKTALLNIEVRNLQKLKGERP